MPIIGVLREDIHQRLGRSYTQEEFEQLCFDFGIELDDVTCERERIRKEQGEQAAEIEGLSDEVEYKIDIPANRYDLLCLEGLTRALRVFLKLDKLPPKYTLVFPETLQRITVGPETARIRPFCVGAVLRNVTFSERSYQSFIELQEKLHQNICRERSLVAIGTHDLDSVKGPFSYEALAPEEIEFVPLKESRSFNGKTLFHYYREEKEQSPLKKYLDLIASSPVYPVIYDSNRVVLSLPPIINGEHSKISAATRNVLIECTATDRTKAMVTLNTICAMFSEYCEDKYTIEPVEIVYETSGEKVVSPELVEQEFTASLEYLNKSIGIDVDLETCQELLNRMQLATEVVDQDKAVLKVVAPITRSDVLHRCDIMEDVAIAYGYNNITKTFPSSQTIGKPQKLNKLTDQLRESLAQAGYTETLTFALVSRQDNFLSMGLDPTEQASCVVLGPLRKMPSLEIVRTSLIPGLLKTLGHNRARMALPVRIFEVSDVCLLDSALDVGSRNERRLSAVFCGRTSGFENIHGLLDRIMLLNQVEFDDGSGSVSADKGKPVYSLDVCDHPSFISGLSANILFNRQHIGVAGVVSPHVLEQFGVDAPCSVLEINMEVFL